MKRLYLSIKNIAQFARRKPYMLLTIVAATATTAFGMLFFFGQALSQYDEYVKNWAETRTLAVTLSGASNDTVSRILADIRSDEFPDVEKLTVYPVEQVKPPSGVVVWGGQRTVEFVGEYFPALPIIQGSNFSQQSANECIANIWAGASDLPYRVGDFIHVGDIAYEVVGIWDTQYHPDYSFVLPVETYLKNGYPVEYIKCFYTQPFSQTQIARLDGVLSGNSILSKTLPSTFEWTAIKDILPQIGIYIAVFIFCLINVFVLINFWITSNIRTYNIYAMCGGRKSHVILIQFMSNLWVTAGAFVIGWIVYLLLLNDKLYFLRAEFKLLNTSLVGLTLIFISSLLSLILAARFFRKRDLYKVGEV